MEKTSIEKLQGIKQFLKQSGSQQGKSIEQIRQQLSQMASKTPCLPDITVETASMGPMHGEWVSEGCSRGEGKPVILYFHGGGFFSGTCENYRDLAARISKASGVQVLLVEYRLAPEHPFPAANEDCIKAYRWLLDEGFAPENIILGGDSAGGSLVLMTLLSLRDSGFPLSKAAFLISPHTDLIHLDGESFKSRAELDPMGSLEGTRWMVETYLGGAAEKPVILSPLNMDLKQLPPLFIQVGDHEVLLSDSVRLAQHAKKAGVEETLEVWDNMWHVFQSMAFMLPEAQQAIDHIGDFIKSHLT